MVKNRVIFACPQCGVQLTAPVSELPTSERVLDDGEQAVPTGFFAFSNDDYWTGSTGCAVVNLNDLQNTRYHPDSSRHNGCCGRDGCDGPNLLCSNGHEIGTERSDCWMAHGVVLLPTVIKKKAP